MKNLTKRKSKEPKAVLNISDPTYEQQLAKGLDPESLLKPDTHRFRRAKHVIKPSESVAVNGKTRITMKSSQNSKKVKIRLVNSGFSNYKSCIFLRNLLVP